MVELSQKNYFFIDFEQKFTNGLVEYSCEGESILFFNIGNLFIKEVIVNDEKNDFVIIEEETNIFSKENLEKESVYQKFTECSRKLKIELKKYFNYVQIKYVPNLEFYEPVDELDKHQEVFGTIENFTSFPYIDKLTKFKLVYVVNSDFLVTSSGQFDNIVEQNDYAIHTYYVTTFPRNISFSIGKFEKYELSPSKYLILPKYTNYSEIKSDILEAQKFLDKLFISDKSNIINFVFSFLNKKSVSDSLIFLSYADFPFIDDIQKNFEFRANLGLFLGSQFFSQIEFNREDLWIKTGLIGYIKNYILKNILGTNEFLFRFRKDIQYVVKVDKYHSPLFSPYRSRISYTSKFVRKKSSIFFQILEHTTSFLSLKKIITVLLNSEKINTKEFINLVKENTGKDLSTEKIIFKNNCTSFSGEVEIDQKKNLVKVHFNGPINTIVQSTEIEGIFEYPIKKELTYNYHNRRKRDEENVLFIKIDPYLTQLHTFKFLLKNTMYNFLAKDKNLISQIEGVPHVDESELERLIYDSHTNHHIRIMALNHLEINSILSFFVKKFCVHGSTIIKPNSFTILSHNLLIGIIKALSYFDPGVERHINGKDLTVGSIIKAFYYNILRYNDNSSNQFHDALFISTIIRSFSYMLTSNENYDLEKFFQKNEIYFDIFERYRLKDLIFPSNQNLITESILFLYGRLEFYGYIDLNLDFLLFLIGNKNFIKIRSAAAEIVTFKAIISKNPNFLEDILSKNENEKNEITKKLLKALSKEKFNNIIEYLLVQDEEVQKTVLKTILNLLSAEEYNNIVKCVLDKQIFRKYLFKTENGSVRHLYVQVLFFLDNQEIIYKKEPDTQQESSESTTNFIQTTPVKRLKINCTPTSKLRVKLSLKDIHKNIMIKRVKPIFSTNGIVKLKGIPDYKKRKAISVTVKKVKFSDKKKFDFNDIFVDQKNLENLKKEFYSFFPSFKNVQTENDMILSLKQILIENKQNSELYNQSLNLLEKIEDSKFCINFKNMKFTLLGNEEKEEIKRCLDLLLVPRCNRNSKYKDVFRKSLTVHFFKKRMDLIILSEFIKLELFHYLKNITFFYPNNNLNDYELKEILLKLPIKSDIEIDELLKECLKLLQTKKVAPFFNELKDNDSEIGLKKISNKIENKEYENLREIELDFANIVSFSEEKYGKTNKVTEDARILMRWFKRIFGGMLGNIYREIDSTFGIHFV